MSKLLIQRGLVGGEDGCGPTSWGGFRCSVLLCCCGVMLLCCGSVVLFCCCATGIALFYGSAAIRAHKTKTLYSYAVILTYSHSRQNPINKASEGLGRLFDTYPETLREPSISGPRRAQRRLPQGGWGPGLFLQKPTKNNDFRGCTEWGLGGGLGLGLQRCRARAAEIAAPCGCGLGRGQLAVGPQPKNEGTPTWGKPPIL